MRKMFHDSLVWLLVKTGWTPTKEVIQQIVEVPRKFSGNSHQRRIMRRAERMAYGR